MALSANSKLLLRNSLMYMMVYFSSLNWSSEVSATCVVKKQSAGTTGNEGIVGLSVGSVVGFSVDGVGAPVPRESVGASELVGDNVADDTVGVPVPCESVGASELVGEDVINDTVGEPVRANGFVGEKVVSDIVGGCVANGTVGTLVEIDGVDVGGSGSLSTLVGASVDNSVGAKLVRNQRFAVKLAPLEGVGSDRAVGAADAFLNDFFAFPFLATFWHLTLIPFPCSPSPLPLLALALTAPVVHGAIPY
jgi:hypothetical protein